MGGAQAPQCPPLGLQHVAAALQVRRR
jgi:hypothetical protein